MKIEDISRLNLNLTCSKVYFFFCQTYFTKSLMCKDNFQKVFEVKNVHTLRNDM